MASKRRLRRKLEQLREKSCTGKIKHETKTDAVAHLINHKKKFKDFFVHTYQCLFCHKWHIGHTDKRKALDIMGLSRAY